MEPERPTVVLLADANVLTLSLVENLLANFCKVKIISYEKEKWENSLSHISQKNYLSTQDLEDLDRESFADYIIVDNFSLGLTTTQIKKAQDFSFKTSAKTIFLLPYSTNTPTDWKNLNAARELLTNTAYGFGIIYIGDMFGPRMALDQAPIGSFLKALLTNKPLKVSKTNFLLYPAPAASAAREIVRGLFSFGPYGEETAFISGAVSANDFIKVLGRFYPNLNYSSGDDFSERKTLELPSKTILRINLEKSLKDTLDWFFQNKSTSEVVTVKQRPQFKEIKVNKENTVGFPKRKVGLILSVAIFLLIFPYFLLAAGGGLLAISLNLLKKGNTSVSQDILAVSLASSSISGLTFKTYSKIPILGNLFPSGIYLSGLVNRGATVSLKVIELSVKSKDLLSKVLGDSVYDPAVISQAMALNLDAIYRDASFLQGEVDNPKAPFFVLFKSYLREVKLSEVRDKVLQAKTLVSGLPSLLGKDKPKTYLLLFQNNMELRPTGGFIGSYALATFDGGRLIDIAVSDVYSADGQLKGYVEPPVPIRDYLGEAGWYLRDSNWDPDFPTSAERAEWFLEKEIDKKVDGVVGVDINLVKGLLEVFGPIYLSDFGQSIDSKNVYERIQYEVESDFFPGSQKKSNFLTSLTRGLMTKVSQASSKEHVPVAKTILKNLEERHIQIFIHDTAFQKVISNLGFDGAVSTPVCEGNCIADWVGVVDANLGVNKANYFVARSQSLNVAFTGGVVRRDLTVNFENKANPQLGQKAKYKGYLRVLLPISVNVDNIKVDGLSYGFDVEDVHGRREVGKLIEVAPGTKKSISVSWESPQLFSFEKAGEYRLYIRKQAGTDTDALSLRLNLPSGRKFSMLPKFSLTQDGSYLYNTQIAKDRFIEVSW